MTTAYGFHIQVSRDLLREAVTNTNTTLRRQRRSVVKRLITRAKRQFMKRKISDV